MSARIALRIARSSSGVSRRFDSSGGVEKYRLIMRLEGETATVYQNLKRFYDMNMGQPGISPVPLLIEPNIPGVPPTLMVNFAQNGFGLTPTRNPGPSALFYGGTLEFETIY